MHASCILVALAAISCQAPYLDIDANSNVQVYCPAAESRELAVLGSTNYCLVQDMAETLVSGKCYNARAAELVDYSKSHVHALLIPCYRFKNWGRLIDTSVCIFSDRNIGCNVNKTHEPIKNSHTVAKVLA